MAPDRWIAAICALLSGVCARELAQKWTQIVAVRHMRPIMAPYQEGCPQKQCSVCMDLFDVSDSAWATSMCRFEAGMDRLVSTERCGHRETTRIEVTSTPAVIQHIKEEVCSGRGPRGEEATPLACTGRCCVWV